MQAPSMVLQSRIVHLPLAFNEQWTHAAIQKYSKSVRAEAPYLPSNVDFVAANNGLQSAAQVRDVVMEASYMVLGLGDVYLGAPCAVPVDPRWDFNDPPPCFNIFLLVSVLYGPVKANIINA